MLSQCLVVCVLMAAWSMTAENTGMKVDHFSHHKGKLRRLLTPRAVASSLRSCAIQCLMVPGCRAFTFYDSTQDCLMYQNCYIGASLYTFWSRGNVCWPLRRTRCRKPTVPDGRVRTRISTRRVNSTVCYVCNVGYSICGAKSNFMTCQPNLEWTSPSPCIKRLWSHGDLSAYNATITSVCAVEDGAFVEITGNFSGSTLITRFLIYFLGKNLSVSYEFFPKPNDDGYMRLRAKYKDGDDEWQLFGQRPTTVKMKNKRPTFRFSFVMEMISVKMNHIDLVKKRFKHGINFNRIQVFGDLATRFVRIQHPKPERCW